MVVEPVLEEIHYVGIYLYFPPVELVFCLYHLFIECPVDFHVLRGFGVSVLGEYFLFLLEMLIGIIEQPAENIPLDFPRLAGFPCGMEVINQPEKLFVLLVDQFYVDAEDVTPLNEILTCLIGTVIEMKPGARYFEGFGNSMKSVHLIHRLMG